ncbi:papain fold toxin domain-containing protein [Neolewinella lacunae]|nr:papain fold toxin domain-containing protein [Neolewinella lacunae]MDN3635958.1 papain fold toxin domain-containing protein [Neolewinella lacunae]
MHNNYGVLQNIIDGISDATKQYHKKYMCKEYGTALREYLIQNGEANPKAVIFRLFDMNGNRAQMRIYHNGEEIATNGLHVGTPINGKMFDNMNPNGMDVDEWLSKFEYPPHLKLKPDVIDASQVINSFY